MTFYQSQSAYMQLVLLSLFGLGRFIPSAEKGDRSRETCIVENTVLPTPILLGRTATMVPRGWPSGLKGAGSKGKDP
jgi:hypothetical protein